MRTTTWLVLAIILLPGTNSVWAANAIFRRIGGQPVDMASDGSVLVNSASYYWPRYSYLIRSNNDSLEIDALGDSLLDATVAASLSNDGRIYAGHAGSVSLPNYLAWIKNPGDDFHYLGTLGGDRSLVRAMSADGQVIVGVSTDSEQRFRGYRWTKASGMTAIDGLPNAMESLAYDISATGDVILGGSTFVCPSCDPGYIYYDCSGECSPPVATYHETFLWTKDRGPISIGRPTPPDSTPNALGRLPKPQSVNAHGMSDDGTTIIGTTTDPNGSFVWRAETGFLPLPNLNGYFHSFYPLDVSADGNLVVGHVPGAGAVIWTPGSGTRLLANVLADEYGLRGLSNYLEQATLVSADGRTIAGHGADDSWWLITLSQSIAAPEPSTLPLLLSFLIGSVLNTRKTRYKCSAEVRQQNKLNCVRVY